MSYRIKTVSELTGIPIGTISAWERRYDLLHPERAIQSGYRIYTDHDVALLRHLRVLLDRGYKISEAIARVQAEQIAPAPPADSPEAALHNVREQLERHLLSFDRASADTLRQRLVMVPFRHAIDHVYLPLLVRIGTGWERGTITIAQEHFAAAWCRDQLVGMLLALGGESTNGPRALCAGFPGDQHELGVLAVAVKLALLGFRVTYLGPDLPAAEVAAVLVAQPVDFVCVSVLYGRPAAEVQAYAQQLVRTFPTHVRLVVGGPGVTGVEPIDGVWFTPRFEDFLALLGEEQGSRTAHGT